VSDRLAPAPLLPEEALDRLALQKLVWTYCHAVDRGDLALVRSLYHDDAIDDHGAMFCGSPDAYVAWLPAMLANWRLMRHEISTMQFLIAGEQAEGVLSCTAWHRTAHGRYLDQYRRAAGVWRFQSRALVLDWTEERAVSAGAMPDDGIATGRAGADDPLYARLPLFRADRAARQPITS
jgi:ketosteroid isomerase-like protein